MDRNDRHNLEYEKGGLGMDGWIRPVCCCGWSGSKHYAYNDWQHHNAREQFKNHVEDKRNGPK